MDSLNSSTNAWPIHSAPAQWTVGCARARRGVRVHLSSLNARNRHRNGLAYASANRFRTNMKTKRPRVKCLSLCEIFASTLRFHMYLRCAQFQLRNCETKKMILINRCDTFSQRNPLSSATTLASTRLSPLDLAARCDSILCKLNEQQRMVRDDGQRWDARNAKYSRTIALQPHFVLFSLENGEKMKWLVVQTGGKESECRCVIG